MKPNQPIKPNPQQGFSEILLYTKPNGHVKAEIYLRNATKNG
jgi:hypothetical protein